MRWIAAAAIVIAAWAALAVLICVAWWRLHAADERHEADR